jgi:uncharacterized membrane protein
MTPPMRISAKAEKIKSAILLATMSLICLSLSLFRYFLTGNTFFLFLNWNLFLAAIPWMISTIFAFQNEQSRTFLFPLLLGVWLLFFPNSPYILTDLIHLRQHGNFPIWYDLILILSFAWTGLSYGLYSLVEIENIISRKTNLAFARLSTIALLFISSFGVYIGRFLRWNSWDIFTNPIPLFHEIGDRFIHPVAHPRTWGLTILLGILLNMIYHTFHRAQSRIKLH